MKTVKGEDLIKKANRKFDSEITLGHLKQLGWLKNQLKDKILIDEKELREYLNSTLEQREYDESLSLFVKQELLKKILGE